MFPLLYHNMRCINNQYGTIITNFKIFFMNQLLVLSASVNYLDYLSFTYSLNKDLFKKYNLNYVIVTDYKDNETYNFCISNSINCYRTDAFYHFNGKDATFNRAGALNEFLKINTAYSSSWILLLDSDIILNEEIIDSFLKTNQANIFYGCGREFYLSYENYQKNKHSGIEQCKHLGFFQLFNIEYLKKKYEELKLINYDYNNNIIISNYNVSAQDGLFANLFPNKQSLGYVKHIGPPYKNWDGRITEQWNINQY